MTRAIRLVVFVAVCAVGVLGISGRWTDPMLLAYVAACGAALLFGTMIVPEGTARARWEPSTPGADPWGAYMFRVLFVSHVIAGTLDTGRFHLTDTVPLPVRIVGLVTFPLAFALTFWAAGVNRFFIPAVRIQDERGHHPVTTGPYAFVRHPGYAGMGWGVPLSGLALGSWTAVAFGVAMFLSVVRRVALEDKFVMASLPGYADYAARVRWRLFPGVW